MATSFAAYASQFLNRQNGTASLSSSQPMFFSFTTDDGSRAGHSADESDLDDLDDPHLRASGESRRDPRPRGDGHDEDEDDPYLRLDEDSGFGAQAVRAAQSTPLIASDRGSVSPSSPKGWLAHLASPMMRVSHWRPQRSPSPAGSSDSDEPPANLLSPEQIRVDRRPSPSPTPQPPPPIPPTSNEPLSLSLTQSLLPRDGVTRPLDVFCLPDPRFTPKHRRKYHDSIWTALWCTGVLICVFFSILLLFVTRKPAKRPGLILPYTTLLHTIPMLTILTFLSAIVAYTHVLLLRIFVKPVMFATSVFVPATLFISALWAFIGSFMWEEGIEPTWGETVGLRLFAIIPLVLSLLTGRRLLNLPRDIHNTSSILNLTTELLMANPFLLALSPAILLLMLLASIPFLTLVFRLLLLGYLTGKSVLEWHIYGYANWAIAGSVCVWLWSWAVARGILRMTCASIIGAWYFSDPSLPPPPPTSTHTIHAALVRSTGPSLGTVALSALILTIIRLFSVLILLLQRLPPYIPAQAFFIVTGIRMLVGYLEAATTALSKHALVYAGLTGDPFMPSARRAKALTNSVESKSRRFGKRVFAEPPLTMLTITPLTLTFPFALMTYLFVAHTLNAPHDALGAAMLAGGVTGLVGLFCVGLVKDTADALYICYCIDKDTGERRREEVFSTFEYGGRPRAAGTAGSAPSQTQPSWDARSHVSPGTTVPSRNPQQQQQQQQQQHIALSMVASRHVERQPLPPRDPGPSRAPPPPVPKAILEEDDLDPFKHSYLDEEPTIRQPEPQPPSSARRLSNPALGGPIGVPHATILPVPPPPVPPSSRRSGEVERRREVASASVLGPYDVDPESQAPPPLPAPVLPSTPARRSLEGRRSSVEEDAADGSQFFPGSGFF